MDEVNVMSLFDKIVYHHKEMTNLMDELQKELFGNKIFDFQDEKESIRNSTPAETDPFAKENFKYEICILQQETYGDRWGSWNEDHFKPIGTVKFDTEDAILDYLNDENNIKTWEKELFYEVCEGRKLYIHNVEKNVYKRLRKNLDGTYYLKK